MPIFTIGRNNHVNQSGWVANPAHYPHQHITYPMLGIVLNVYLSDDPANSGSKTKQDGRASHAQADVLIVNDGRGAYWVLKKVVIPPKGHSGIDDYDEELPQPCTMVLDGTKYDSDLRNVDVSKLDGSWAVVNFIGGSINQPFIQSYWPHPYNRTDPATGASPEKGNLAQGRRLFKRALGTKFTVTNQGSVHIDTSEAGSTIQPGNHLKKYARVEKDEGGDINFTVKNNRSFELNFNPPIPLPESEPSLPQVNPPEAKESSRTRATDSSYFTANKDFINAVAGAVVQMIGKQIADSILLGANPTDHAIKGETHQVTFNIVVARLNQLIDDFNSHVHPVDPASFMTLPPMVNLDANPNFEFPPVPISLENLPRIGTPPIPDHAPDMLDSELSTVVKLE